MIPEPLHIPENCTKCSGPIEKVKGEWFYTLGEDEDEIYDETKEQFIHGAVCSKCGLVHGLWCF